MTKLLGLIFRPMPEEYRDGFAGARGVDREGVRADIARWCRVQPAEVIFQRDFTSVSK